MLSIEKEIIKKTSELFSQGAYNLEVKMNVNKRCTIINFGEINEDLRCSKNHETIIGYSRCTVSHKSLSESDIKAEIGRQAMENYFKKNSVSTALRRDCLTFSSN